MTTTAERPFDHIVITRFSGVFQEEQDAPDEGWLFYRLGFFQDALFASIEAQVGAGPLRWLVFFDDRCSDDFRLEIERLSASGVFEPVWTHEVFWQIVADEVAARARAPYLITTRIDSDDAVAVDFVASVQAQFVPVERLAVTFPLGLQLARDQSVYAYREVSGPFMSLIERRHADRCPLTVWCSPLHGAMRAHAPLREVQAPPMWMQVIHGANASNARRGFPTRPERVGERFVVTLPLPEPISRRALLVRRAHGVVHRARFWHATPFFAAEWADATIDRLRGTHTKPQKDGTSAPSIVDRSRIPRGIPRNAPFNDGSFRGFV